MSRKKLAPLRDNSIEELEAKVVDLRNSLSKERAVIASGTRAEKPAKIGNMRRQVARILTIIDEKRKGSSNKKSGKEKVKKG